MELNSFVIGLNKAKPLLLSLDLDDTVVIRDKGDNFVPEKTKKIIEEIQKLPNVHLLINTGRDVIGTSAFQIQGCNIKDALMMSGAISMIDNELFPYNGASLNRDIITYFLELVKQGIIPFIDCTGCGIRKLFYNSIANKDLFFSQNPKSRFIELPQTLIVNEITTVNDSFFRVEFPVGYEDELFVYLKQKDTTTLEVFNRLYKAQFSNNEFRMNKKNFFGSEELKKTRCFGRFEKSWDYCNKGIGLKYRIEVQNQFVGDWNIIHVGDQDEGVINDTLVKKYIEHANVVMVGDECKKDNSLVSLYLPGDREEAIYQLLEQLYLYFK